jgi:hypothetical protein
VVRSNFALDLEQFNRNSGASRFKRAEDIQDGGEDVGEDGDDGEDDEDSGYLGESR